MQGLAACAANGLQTFGKIYYVADDSECPGIINDCLNYETPTDIPPYEENYDNTVVMCF